MVDHIKGRLEKIKRYSDSAKRRASLYTSIAKIDDKRAASSLHVLRKAPDPGRKLTKIGFIIFWIPEPTGISNAVGAPMILAGKYLEKKYNGATINDIGKETQSTFSTLKDFKSTVM